jgi:hypothetical protein
MPVRSGVLPCAGLPHVRWLLDGTRTAIGRKPIKLCALEAHGRYPVEDTTPAMNPAVAAGDQGFV